MNVWDTIQDLRLKAKETNDPETKAYYESEILSLVPSLNKTDKKIIRIMDKQKKAKELGNLRLNSLLKIQRYVLKTEKHIEHLIRDFQENNPKQESHFHRLESRIDHLHDMVKEYKEKYHA